MIECKQLTKRFGEKTALNQVDLQVQPGSIFGLVGSNVPRYEQKTLSIT